MSAQGSVSKPESARRHLDPWLATVLHLFIVLTVLAGFVALWWVTTLPDRVGEQQTIIVGRTQFAPDSDASVRVVVQDIAAGKPIAGARVKVSLKPDTGRAIPLFEGATDESGSLPVLFHVPADAPAEATLVVETRSSSGKDRIEQQVSVQREYRLLLSSDKPLYQPGQVIHMRALALSTFDLTPARGATVKFTVEDAKGNKVYRESVAASDFGVAAADFQLADMVNQGSYKLSVAIGATQSEKTVEVRPYVLPKFGVTATTERSFYLPGQRVQGVVQADYFFGKPVAQGQVHIVGSVWDVERTVLVDLVGETDDNGSYDFSFDLPQYFAGSGMESGQAQFALQVTVVDQTDHPEETSAVLPVAAQPLVIEAVAESGSLKPGVENIVYVLTSYPDGQPASTSLSVRVDSGAPVELKSGEFGLAQFTLNPRSGQNAVLEISARDDAGLTAQRQMELNAEGGSDCVLLRSDRAAYLVGETMNLVALTPVSSGSVYMDIVKGGQTLSTRSAQVVDGRAEFAVDVTPDLYGTLEIHAYKVLLDGAIVRDTRLVVVDAPNDLAIDISADRDTYLPGDQATIAFHTADAASGDGVQTALGLAIVDESVFALQSQDPGFAKLYFLLRQELMEPFYQIQGFEVPSIIYSDQPQQGDVLRQAGDSAAKASWADIPVAGGSEINSREEKLSSLQVVQQRGFTRLGEVSAAGMILAPLALWAVVIAALWGSGVVKRSLARLLVLLGVVVLIGACLAGWLVVAQRVFYTNVDPETVLIPLAVLVGLGLLVFSITAWIARDPAGKLFSLITLAWGGLLALLIVSSKRGGDPVAGLLITAFVALLLLPAAYLLFGQIRWLERRHWIGGLGVGLGLVSALPAMVLVPAAVLSLSSGWGGSGMPALEEGVRGGAPAMQDALGIEKGMLMNETEVEAPAAAMPLSGEEAHAQSGEPPRLRQFFPETLYWMPELVTDETGSASLEVPMADSITTWRLTALASSQDGRLSFASSGLRVFQDFFVDVDLPVALTQGDEISIPVGVFNYLPEPQEVRLVVDEEPWFELLGESEQRITIAANDIEVVYFPIRVLKFGRNAFQVTAWGEQMNDAIRREVTVVPDGKEMRLTESDWLRESKELDVSVPAEAVYGTASVEVKIYPGVMAQAVEGLEKILRLPHG